MLIPATKYAKIGNYIGGKTIIPFNHNWLEVVSPTDGSLLSKVPMSKASDLDEAVKAAQAAFDGWSKMPIKERAQVFFRYKTFLERDIEELTFLVHEENGKTLDEARAEIEKSIELTEFACAMPQLVQGELLEVSKAGSLIGNSFKRALSRLDAILSKDAHYQSRGKQECKNDAVS